MKNKFIVTAFVFLVVVVFLNILVWLVINVPAVLLALFAFIAIVIVSLTIAEHLIEWWNKLEVEGYDKPSDVHRDAWMDGDDYYE